ncbi:MAG TPA: hypothetical protein VH370_24825 [Humisphaera sp.]|jgi:hypothetical protein|nr:hypothetical protein [Humisphaera sp.]
MAASVSNVLDRFLSPLTDHLTPEAAEQLVDFQVDPLTQAKIDELADKANEGLLTDAERAEYFQFVEVIDLIGILQSKARQTLLRRNA